MGGVQASWERVRGRGRGIGSGDGAFFHTQARGVVWWLPATWLGRTLS